MGQQNPRKKWNPNGLVFVLAMLFLLLGFRGYFFRQMFSHTGKLVNSVLHGDGSALATFAGDVDNLSATALSYHDILLDLDSLKENLLGTRVVSKEDTMVAKADQETLMGYFQEEKSQDAIRSEAGRIEELYLCAEAEKARFLYCLFPGKGYLEGCPQNIEDYSRENQERLYAELVKREVPCLSFWERLLEKGVLESELFFHTDHHWKPLTGFTASGILCQELQTRYSFPWDRNLSDLRNYRVETYPDSFLGSYGKKVGRYFTWQGLDDFDLITPAFETDLTEERPLEGWERSGTFEETALHLDHLGKDVYHGNAYAVYSGGDFRLQILKNRKKPDGAKILLIRDSFSCVVAPFLALQAGELHLIDDREGSYPPGERVDVREYIRQQHFDYVIVAETKL